MTDLKILYKTFLFFVIFAVSGSMFAQERFTISGYVKDASSGENLIGANVYIKDNLRGVSTNQYGFYSLTVDKGAHTLVASFIGYETVELPISLTQNLRKNFSLEPQMVLTDEVVISAEREDKNVKSTEMGTINFEVERIKTLPAFLGEVDILKTIQLTPGVQSAGEGNTGMYVRGGGPDQNLVLLDEAVVYNASHLFGFFSVFNADAIKNVNLIKGGMPANYGGRLASVLDISMKDGNNRTYHAEGGIGLISSRLTIQGPIQKERSSFIVSGRRTYIDVLTKPFINKKSPLKSSGYYFYDLNAKANYLLSDKDRLYISGYFGRDVFGISNKEADFKTTIAWGNATTSLRWNHLFSEKLFLNTSIIYSDYDFDFSARQTEFDMALRSGVRDWNGKLDFNYFPNSFHNLKFGLNYIYHIFTPNNASARVKEVDIQLGDAVKLYSHEGALYVNDEVNLTENFALNGGLRYSYFQHVGPFDRYVIGDLNRIVDTISYKRNESIKVYNHIEPRFSLRYTLNEKSSLKASYTQNYQYIHLASVSGVTLPTDIWVPSTDIVKPLFGVQYALGYFRNFFSNEYETSIEVYYKTMDNIIEFKEGATPENNVNNNIDNNFAFGKGESYGAEFFINKKINKITGWIGYTLSWAHRDFPDINGGKRFPAKYDRRHDLSVVVSYDLNDKFNFAAVFVYATGNAVTIPIGRYFIEGSVINEYGDRNSYRMEPYHRMDISINYLAKKSRKFESSFNLSVYNVYNRANPYFIYFENVGSIDEMSLQIKAKQVSLFPILPSIGWNFKF
ncbi:MAG: TonB-dependent receptor [Bacteroidales bacterium]|nr:TonB-dependent receptor [Bacteroidales bacterium]